MKAPIMTFALLGIFVIGTSANQSWSESSTNTCRAPYCLYCKSEFECGICEEGFMMQGGQCIKCPEGFYLSDRGCAPCPEGCKACSNECKCSSCLPGFEADGDVCKACENYTSGCTVCSNPIANLIKNGDFESPPFLDDQNNLPLEGWLPYGLNDPDLVRNAPDGGTQSLHLRQNDESYQVIPGLHPGESYTLSFYCQSKDQSSSQNIGVTAFQEAQQVMTCPVFDTTWNFYVIALVASSNIETITFASVSNSNVLLDGVSLVKTSDLDPDCPECLDGFYVDMGECTACPDSNCSTCELSMCSKCNEDSFFNDLGECILCSSVFTACDECDSHECKKCAFGYRVYRGQCYKWDEDCTYFDSYYNKCTKCKEGYYLSNYSCVPVQEEIECEGGYLNDFRQCVYCETGSYPGEGACFACLDDCEACSDGESCTQCAVGFEWTGSKCEKCEIYIDKCTVCSSPPENIIKNGDFESPPYQEEQDGVPLDHWSPGNFDPDLVRDAPDGNFQSMNLRRDMDTASQTVDLEAGETYLLTFYCIADFLNDLGTVQLTGLGESSTDYTCPPLGPRQWEKYTVTYTAPSDTSETITFTAPGASDNSNRIFLDKVSLVRTAELVPVCPVCFESYYPANGECVPCSDPNCTVCEEDVCSSCKDGLYLNGSNQCVSCHKMWGDYCEECSSSSCSKCQTGFISYYGWCFPVKDNCIYVDWNSCGQCLDGFFWYNYKCYPYYR